MRLQFGAVLCVALGLFVGGCDEEENVSTSKTDASPDGGDSGGGDGGTDVAIENDPPCGADPTPRKSPALTTRMGTWIPKKSPIKAERGKNPAVSHDAIDAYTKAGLAELAEGPGEDGGVNDLLMKGATSSRGVTGRKSVAYLVHLSDTQLVDDESPARLLAFDNEIAGGAGRPQEAAVAHVTSAMHRTFAEIAKKTRPFDFELVTGDCADNAQRNELEWFIDLMNGKKGLKIDSGEPNDPVAGPLNDPKDAFDPVGAVAPWFFVFGNHDLEQQGTSKVDAFSKAVAIGTTPTGGTRDYRLKFAPVTREEVPADPRRIMLERPEIVDLVRKSDGNPRGHGFPETSPGAVPSTHYITTPIAGKPIRLIEVDTSDPDGGSDGGVTKKTLREFLEPALAAADKENVVVILTSHHATPAINNLRGLAGEVNPDLVTGEELEAAVAKHPSVVLWLVGHDHANRIRAVAGPSSDAPGYYEVMTSAIADWPIQGRIIEMVEVPPSTPGGEKSLSIYVTMVDYEAKTCIESRFRSLALLDVNSGWSPSGSGRPTDRNVELRRVMPKGVVFTTGSDRIETEGALSGK